MLHLGEHIIKLSSVDSTNNYLSKLISTTNVPNGTVILAQHQTNGRGQRENKWLSELDKNLMMSLFLQFNQLKIQDNFFISMMAANAIHQTLLSYNISSSIKWPNDILVKEKKIAGILIENTVSGYYVSQSILGIGININQKDFGDIRATSLTLELGKQSLISDFFNDLLIHLSNGYRLILLHQEKKIKEYYLTHLLGYNQLFSYRELTTNLFLNGTILDVMPTGELVVLSENKKIKYQFKEIAFCF